MSLLHDNAMTTRATDSDRMSNPNRHAARCTMNMARSRHDDSNHRSALTYRPRPDTHRDARCSSSAQLGVALEFRRAPVSELGAAHANAKQMPSHEVIPTTRWWSMNSRSRRVCLVSEPCSWPPNDYDKRSRHELSISRQSLVFRPPDDSTAAVGSGTSTHSQSFVLPKKI